METISSGLRAAGSAIYSVGEVALSGLSSAGSWLGRQISWLHSATKSAASTARASSASSDLPTRPSLLCSNDSDGPNAGPITTKVAAEPAPPPVSFQTFVCYEAVARTLDEHPPSNMPPEAKKNLNVSLTCFNLSTKPGISKSEKEFYKNRAVSLTQAAISKCPPDTQSDINITLSKLGTQYDVLNEQLSQGTEEEIDPQEIFQNLKAELSKTAQASLAPQETKAQAVLQSMPQPKIEEDLKLQACQELNTKLVALRADTKLSSLYARHFEAAEKHLGKAKEFYRAGNFTLGDEQYGHAHRLADAPRYMELRTKLGITQVKTEGGTKDSDRSDKLKNEGNATVLKSYRSAVSSLKDAGIANSAAEYEKSIQAVETYLQSQTAAK